MFRVIDPGSLNLHGRAVLLMSMGGSISKINEIDSHDSHVSEADQYPLCSMRRILMSYILQSGPLLSPMICEADTYSSLLPSFDFSCPRDRNSLLEVDFARLSPLSWLNLLSSLLGSRKSQQVLAMVIYLHSTHYHACASLLSPEHPSALGTLVDLGLSKNLLK